MSTLREASEQYLQFRRELGYKLRGVACRLRSFVAFAEREGAAHVTTDLALRWAQQLRELLIDRLDVKSVIHSGLEPGT